MDYEHACALKGNLESVKNCYAYGALNVNLSLQYAAEGGHHPTIEFLLKVGASPNSGLEGAPSF
jgi:hypothetical protein